MKHLIFWAVLSLVCVPVIIGLISNEIAPALFALVWAAAWWWLFSSTKIGRRAFIKGYKIACSIMSGADV